MMQAQEPFVWGAGGAQSSKERAKMLRERAERLLAAIDGREQGIDVSPVQHWLQGAARVAGAAAGAYGRYRDGQQANTAASQADAIDAAGRANADKAFSSLTSWMNGGQGAQSGQPSVQASPKAASMRSGGNASPSGDGASQFKPLFAAAEQQYGLPSGYLDRVALTESGYNPRAKNPSSSAGGLFQFIDDTAKRYGLQDRYNPEQATDAAARLARDNAKTLRSRLGREPTAGELYLAHQQGAGGALKLLTNPDAPAASVVGSQAANLNAGRGLTAGQLANRWMAKFDDLNGGPAPVIQAADNGVPRMAIQPIRQGGMQTPPQGVPVQRVNDAPQQQPMNMPTQQQLLAVVNDEYATDAQRFYAKQLLEAQMKLDPRLQDPLDREAKQIQIEQGRTNLAKAPLEMQKLEQDVALARTREEREAAQFKLDQALRQQNLAKGDRDLSAVDVETMTAPNGQVYERRSGTQDQWKPTLALPDKADDYDKYVVEERAAGRTPVNRLEFKKSGGITVNNGPQGVDYGKAPEGFVWKRDKAGVVQIDEDGAPMAVAIKGTKPALEADKLAKTTAERTKQKGTSSNLVAQDIDRAVGVLESNGNWAAGPGSILSGLPGSSARSLSGLYDTIKGNITLEKLQAMREASPTGGALGAVTAPELQILGATLGSLDQGADPAVQIYNLKRARNAIMEIVHGKGNFEPIDLGNDPLAPKPSTVDDILNLYPEQ